MNNRRLKITWKQLVSWTTFHIMGDTLMKMMVRQDETDEVQILVIFSRRVVVEF